MHNRSMSSNATMFVQSYAKKEEPLINKNEYEEVTKWGKGTEIE